MVCREKICVGKHRYDNDRGHIDRNIDPHSAS